MFDADSASDGRLQRSHGEARLRFDVAAGRKRVHSRYGAAPLRVLTPAPEDDAPEAVLANTAGGVAGGDSLKVTVEVEAEGDATVSGQAAEKVYRAIDAPARIGTTLKVAAGGRLEWLPQETILFDGARVARSIDVDLAEDARLLLAEMLVFGRRAHGEDFAAGALDDRWRIDRGGAPVWRDRLRVAGEDPAFAAPAGFAGARALATVIYAGRDAARLLDRARAALPEKAIDAGATVVRDLLVVRMLGPEAGRLKQALGRVVAALRAEAMGRPARPPRVWLC